MNNTPYKMPAVGLGEIVLWYPDKSGATDPLVAIVTRVYGHSLSLSILHENSYNFTVRDGVKHKADPTLKTTQGGDEGCWEHRPERFYLDRLIAREMQSMNRGEQLKEASK